MEGTWKGEQDGLTRKSSRNRWSACTMRARRGRRLRGSTGLRPSALDRWISRINATGSTKEKDNRSAEENELLALRKENARLRVEEGIAEIESYGFLDCDSLKSVRLPKSLKSIGESVFNGCVSLTEITYAGTVAEWASVEVHKGAWILTGGGVAFQQRGQPHAQRGARPGVRSENAPRAPAAK